MEQRDGKLTMKHQNTLPSNRFKQTNHLDKNGYQIHGDKL
jgi:hypothetical protein